MPKHIKRSLSVKNIIIHHNFIPQYKKLPRPVARKDKGGIKPDGDLPIEINTGSERRNKYIKLIYDALRKTITEPDPNLNVRQRIFDIAMRIENKIFQNSDQMINEDDYKRNCYSKLWNLKDKNNPNFVKKVASGVISPEDVANMTSEEMASPEVKRKNAAVRHKWFQQTMRPQIDLKPMKLDSDGSLCGAFSGSGPTIWVQREPTNIFTNDDTDNEYYNNDRF
ncbi:transcription elongation factor S-ii [Gigaspora margarita]|uniref:Transcription elongation factor S-ii n=1 Tax=Gigaspora margarita TaxID=4874 RepID=A0A8H3WWW8_GIGMA|nr:transcription elongation factor S-ii [Gigaspora margarita]